MFGRDRSNNIHTHVNMLKQKLQIWFLIHLQRSSSCLNRRDIYCIKPDHYSFNCSIIYQERWVDWLVTGYSFTEYKGFILVLDMCVIALALTLSYV